MTGVNPSRYHPALVAQAVEAEPRRDGREVGLERSHRVLRRGVVHAHEGLLDDLLGVGPVAGDPVGEREHRRAQLCKGVLESHGLCHLQGIRHASTPKRDSNLALSHPGRLPCLVSVILTRNEVFS